MPSQWPCSPKPELQILGISTTFGDTELRPSNGPPLGEAGRQEIPVATGTPTQAKALSPSTTTRSWSFAKPFHPQSTELILTKSAANPGQITLGRIGPW